MYKNSGFFYSFDLWNYSFTPLKYIQVSTLEINKLKGEQIIPRVLRNKMIHCNVHRPPNWTSRMQNTPSFPYNLIPI